jgi:peptide/nickel transport system substrate-binding protein
MRIYFAFSILTCLILGLVSCGKEQTVEQTDAQGGKKYGGIYRMNEVGGIRTLDPVRLNDAPSHHIVHQIYDLLIDFDSSLTIQPELAESFDVSEDGITYTYHLRKGVLFHDSPVFHDGKGREMKASDIKYCFDRILDAKSQTLGATYFLDKVKGAQQYYDATGSGNPPSTGVEGFRVVDDYTFAVDLIKPFAAFKYYPALGFCYIYPKEAVDKYGQDFFKNPVGTGAFVFDHWEKDQELVLKRNPHYWRKDEAGNQLPLLDGVVFTFIRDEKQQLNEFQLGKLEEAYRIPTEFLRTVLNEDGSLTPDWAQFRLDRVPALSTQYYGMLSSGDVFKDIRIRKAFNYSIDREKVIKYVLQGQANGPAIHGLTPPSMPGYNTGRINGYSYNLDSARALMAAAGFPQGKGFPSITLQLNSGGGRNELVAEAIQDMLVKGLGIDVKLQVLEWSQHLELVENGKANFWRAGWIADYPEPENFLNLLYSKNIPKEGPSAINSTRYSNPQFDALFEQALATLDDAARYDLYAQAEQIAVNDAAMLWIFYDLDYRMVQPYVRGYNSNAMDRRDLTWTWLDYADNNVTAQK